MIIYNFPLDWADYIIRYTRHSLKQRKQNIWKRKNVKTILSHAVWVALYVLQTKCEKWWKLVPINSSFLKALLYEAGISSDVDICIWRGAFRAFPLLSGSNRFSEFLGAFLGSDSATPGSINMRRDRFYNLSTGNRAQVCI